MADTAEQTENQEQEKSTEQKPSEQKSDDNQKAIDEAIAKAKAEWEKNLEQKLKDAENEGMRKAKMTNEQRQKEADDKERAEFEKAKAEFEREKIVAYAETELAKVGLSAEIAKYIIAEDKDSTKTVIDKIKESYDKDVQAGVTERLKGKTPNLNGGSGGHNTGSFMDIIRENQR
jgi:membrane protein involved in colicin uptake